jgi:capsular polysaccharide biosynthesis protein
MLTISNPTNTRYLNIRVRSADTEEATKIANAFGSVAQEVIKEKMKTEEPTVLDDAVTSRIPVSPQKTRNVMSGGLLGAMLIIGIFFLVFIMDDKLKSSDDITRYFGLPTLAVMPMLGGLDPKAKAVPKGKRPRKK